MSEEHTFHDDPEGFRCACENWASRDSMMTALAGHHENCEKRPDDRKVLTKLIAGLVRGMEFWASDEDGIHPQAWGAYKMAKMFLGEPIDE